MGADPVSQAPVPTVDGAGRVSRARRARPLVPAPGERLSGADRRRRAGRRALDRQIMAA